MKPAEARRAAHRILRDAACSMRRDLAEVERLLAIAEGEPEDEAVAERRAIENSRDVNPEFGVFLPKERPCILIDTREQVPLHFSSAVDVEICTLPTGDYSLRGYTAELAIERKSLADLLGCCTHDRERFLAQIERLREYPVRALVIEADMAVITCGSYRSNVNPLSILGTLIKCATDCQVPVWLAGDAANAALLVERMLLRHARKAQVKR